MPWQPMSMKTPPPDLSTSQNQAACGPKCFSLCLTRYTLPNAPWSAISLAFTYFGVKNSSSAYISSTPCRRQTSIMSSASSSVIAQRLLADHVLARAGDVDGHLGVQIIRRGDRDHLDILLRQHLAIVVEDARDAVSFRQRLGMPGVGEATATTSASSGIMRNDSPLNIRLEPRADDPHLHFAIRRHNTRWYTHVEQAFLPVLFA